MTQNVFDFTNLPENLNEPQNQQLAEVARERLAKIIRYHTLGTNGKAFLERLAAIYPDHIVDIVANFYSAKGDKISIPRYLIQDEPDPTWLRDFLTGHDDLGADEVTTTWLKKRFLREDPLWLSHLQKRDEAKVARVFLLSGNIADYAFDPCEGYRPGKDLLISTLQETKDSVLSISLSQGIKVLAQDERIYKTVMKKINSWTEGGIFSFNSNRSLIHQICDLFIELRIWLEDKAIGQEDRVPLDRGIAIVFENIHLLIPQDSSSFLERNFLIDSLLSWSLSRTLFQTNHSLILVSEYLEDVSQELVSKGGKIDKISIDRPSTPDSRLKFLMALMQRQAAMKATRYHQQILSNVSLATPEESFIGALRRLSNETAGLNLMGIEDVVQEANYDKLLLDSTRLMKAKGERLKQESEGLLEIMATDRDSELAGYPEIKKRLDEVINALKSQAMDPLIQDTIPMGILFLGPPGTGKTIAAQELARKSEINMIKLGDFRGQYVGQSERNLSRILNLIESLHPVIVFMDELDQSEGVRGGDGDSGVSRRVFGKLLEFMSDPRHRGQILWIGASNRPDNIDPAMKRAGRFDLVLPFLLPDQQSRLQIFQYLLNKRLSKGTGITHVLNHIDWEYLAKVTEAYSGAEIEALVNEVLRRVAQERIQSADQVVITLDHFKTVLNLYAPPAIRKRYRKWEDDALIDVRFEDLIAEEYRSRWRKLQNLDQIDNP